MAVIKVTIGRPDHYAFVPLAPGFSMLEAAECVGCAATWTKGEPHNRWDTFADWAMWHQAPTIIRTTVRCAGGLIRVEELDSNSVGWCPTCHRYRPTHVCEGYDGAYYEPDPHPIYVAVVR